MVSLLFKYAYESPHGRKSTSVQRARKFQRLRMLIAT